MSLTEIMYFQRRKIKAAKGKRIKDREETESRHKHDKFYLDMEVRLAKRMRYKELLEEITDLLGHKVKDLGNLSPSESQFLRKV